VPKHATGRVHVTVHASPNPGAVARRPSDEERDLERGRRGGGGGGETPTDDGFPMDAIRQRTDVEWTVEQRSASSMRLARG